MTSRRVPVYSEFLSRCARRPVPIIWMAAPSAEPTSDAIGTTQYTRTACDRRLTYITTQYSTRITRFRKIHAELAVTIYASVLNLPPDSFFLDLNQWSRSTREGRRQEPEEAVLCEVRRSLPRGLLLLRTRRQPRNSPSSAARGVPSRPASKTAADPICAARLVLLCTQVQ